MKPRLLAMALCPLLMTGILHAQTTAPATRTLTGIVVDEAGQPVAHVAVVHGYTSAGQTTTSAADGSFSLQVPAETYPYGQTVATETGSRRIASFRQSKVMPGEPVALQRLVLHPARVLSVSVADAAAHPIAGATVAAGESFSNLAQALTDDAGQATLLVPADAPLSYLVAFKHGAGLDYALVWRKDEPHSDPYRLEPDFTAPVKLTLNGAKAFTLHVEDGNHQPLAGVKVHPWYFKKPDRGDDLNIGLSDFGRTTDAGGNATLDYLPADNTQPIAIWFRKEGYFAPERCAYDPRQVSRHPHRHAPAARPPLRARRGCQRPRRRTRRRPHRRRGLPARPLLKNPHDRGRRHLLHQRRSRHVLRLLRPERP